jgi:serine protease
MHLIKRILFAAAIACLCTWPAIVRADTAQEIIIKFKPGIAEQVKTGLVKKHGALDLLAFYRDRFRVMRLPASSNMQGVVAALAKHPSIAYAEPNRILHAFFVPNDEAYPSQWHLQLINMEEAWDTSTGSGVTVAVVDTGVSPYGADGFGGRLLSGYNAFFNITAFWQDANCHGTHVAGTIAQQTNNGTGAAGVAFNAKILPVRALNRFGAGSTAAVAAGIRWAADHGAQVINLSLGDTESSQTLQEAITYAYDKGVVIVAAAGNYSDAGSLAPVAYPAAYPEVIAVGAVDAKSTRAYYSCGGAELALMAPGGIDSDDTGDGQPDGVLQETFWEYLGFPWFDIGIGLYYLMGTSMASPHVAGVAALVKSIHPDWGPEEIRQALTETATHLGSPGRNDEYGYGLVNAAAAVAY